jgi:hypothetical protein
MITALIAAGSSVFYAAGWAITGRMWFQYFRPYTEPITCAHKDSSWHTHHSSCYKRRPDALTNSAEEAAVYGMLLGLIWPVLALLFWVPGWAIMSRARPLPEETAAKIERLERELGRRQP